MRIVSVEPVPVRSDAASERLRQEGRAEDFESSLMDVIDSGEEFEAEQERPHDEEMDSVELRAEEDAAQPAPTPEALALGLEVPIAEAPVAVAGESVEESGERPRDAAPRLAPPAVDPQPEMARGSQSAGAGQGGAAPPQSDSPRDVQAPVPTPATAATPAATPAIAPEAAPEASPEAVREAASQAAGEERRVDGTQQAEQTHAPRETLAQGARGAGRPAAEDPLASQARSGSAQESPEGTRPLAADLASDDGERRSGNGDDRGGDRGASHARDAAPAEPTVRASATEEIPIESQSVRTLATDSPPAAGVAELAPAIGVASANAPPLEPIVAAAEPSAPPSSSRPMPPEAIPQHIEWLVARGGGSARIELHPPELGKVSIHVTLRGGEVQVVMNVQEVAAQTLVAEYRDSLENGLAAKDLKLDQFEVRDWASRDGSQSREHEAGNDRPGSEAREQTRAQRGSSQLRGVAGLLMQRGPANGSMGDGDGINLRV